MADRNPHARQCPHCGQQFGNAWGGVGRAKHLWEVHGIPAQATFNGKVIKFPKDTGAAKFKLGVWRYLLYGIGFWAFFIGLMSWMHYNRCLNDPDLTTRDVRICVARWGPLK